MNTFLTICVGLAVALIFYLGCALIYKLCALIWRACPWGRNAKRILLPMILLASLFSAKAQVWTNLLAGVGESHDILFAAYPGFAPDLKIDGVKKPWGFGIAGLYPIGDHVFTGLRLDFLAGQFWAPSVDVGVNYTLNVITNHPINMFSIGGVLVPLGGAGSANGDFGAIVGGGVSFRLLSFHNGQGTVDAFYGVEKWTRFDGVVHRPGVALNWHF